MSKKEVIAAASAPAPPYLSFDTPGSQGFHSFYYWILIFQCIQKFERSIFTGRTALSAPGPDDGRPPRLVTPRQSISVCFIPSIYSNTIGRACINNQNCSKNYPISVLILRLLIPSFQFQISQFRPSERQQRGLLTIDPPEIDFRPNSAPDPRLSTSLLCNPYPVKFLSKSLNSIEPRWSSHKLTMTGDSKVLVS